MWVFFPFCLLMAHTSVDSELDDLWEGTDWQKNGSVVDETRKQQLIPKQCHWSHKGNCREPHPQYAPGRPNRWHCPLQEEVYWTCPARGGTGTGRGNVNNKQIDNTHKQNIDWSITLWAEMIKKLSIWYTQAVTIMTKWRKTKAS